MVIDLLRKKVLQKAQKLVDEKRLDSRVQIFDLTIDNIDQSLTDPSLDLRALAKKNTFLINKIKKSHLTPQLIDSRGKIF